MKNFSKISQYNKVTVFILCLLISLMGTLSSEGLPIQDYDDAVGTTSDQELPDTQESDSENNLIVEHHAISSSAHLTVIYQPLLLMNITYDENDTGEIEDEQNTQHDQLFRRLFKRVISPNAP